MKNALQLAQTDDQLASVVDELAKQIRAAERSRAQPQPIAQKLRDSIATLHRQLLSLLRNLDEKKFLSGQPLPYDGLSTRITVLFGIKQAEPAPKAKRKIWDTRIGENGCYIKRSK